MTKNDEVAHWSEKSLSKEDDFKFHSREHACAIVKSFSRFKDDVGFIVNKDPQKVQSQSGISITTT